MPTNTCKKCKKEYREWRSMYAINLELCSECEDKENRNTVIFCICCFLVVLGIILGIRVAWAKLVYKDARCAWAECRIQVNP